MLSLKNSTEKKAPKLRRTFLEVLKKLNLD